MEIDVCIKYRQFRKFDIVLYPDCETYHLPSGIACSCLDLILEITHNNKNLFEYAYIMHDHDIEDDGSHKKNHYHLFIRFRAGYTIQALSNRYGIPVSNFSLFPKKNKSGEVVGYEEPDRKQRLRYLTHGGDKDADKYQYDPERVVTNVTDFTFGREEDATVALDNLVDFCIEHTYEEGWRYAQQHDLRREFRSYYGIADKIKGERQCDASRFNLSAMRMTDNMIRDTYKHGLKFAEDTMREYVEAAFFKCMGELKPTQGQFFYDAEGNILGVTGTDY